MSTADRLPRGITHHEAPYLTKSVDELGALAQRLVDAGHSPETVRNLIGWLALKAAGMKDRSAQTTKAQYRRMLAELDDPRPRKRSVAGTAGTMALLIVAIPMVAGLSLVDRRRRILCAQRLYITYIAGVEVLVVFVVVEIPAVEREIESGPGAEIHTLSAHRRPPMHTLCAAPKAA